MRRSIITFITKRCLVILGLLTIVAVQTLAQSPNNVLAQLGVNGVTDKIYGTNASLYAGYLIKTGTNGLFDISPFPTSIRPVAANKMLYVDSVKGHDTTNDVGSVTDPYKTLNYAISNSVDGTTIVLAPGSYAGPTITNTAINNLTLMGYNPTGTVVTGVMTFDSAVNNINLELYRLTVNEIKQNQYRHLTVSMFDGARVLNRVYRQYPTSINSYLYVYRDPSVTIGIPIVSSSNTFDVLIHSASNMAYYASDTNKWAALYGGVPANIGNALDRLTGGYVLYTNSLIPSDFVPAVDLAYRLGRATNRWLEVYGGTFYGYGTGLTNVPYGQTYLLGCNGSFVTNYGANVPGALSAATNGQTVYMGPGLYTISAYQNIPAGVRLAGAGRSTTIIQSIGNVTPVLYAGNDTTIENLTVNADTASSRALVATGVTNVMVRNCTLRGATTAPGFSMEVSPFNPCTVAIHDSYLEGVSGISVLVADGRLSVYNSTIKATGSGGYGVTMTGTAAFNALFDGCRIEGSDGYGYAQLSSSTTTLSRCSIVGYGGSAIGNSGSATCLYEFGCNYTGSSGAAINHTNMWCAAPTDDYHTVNKAYVTAAITNVPYGQTYLLACNGSYVTNYGVNVSNALAAATNGQTVYIGPGTYDILGTCAVSNGVRVTGAGRYATKLLTTNTYVQPMLAPGSDVSVENMTLYASGTYSYAVIVQAATNVVIRDCKLYASTSYALSGQASVGTVTIEDCELLCNDAGLAAFEAVSGEWQFINCNLYGVGQAVYLDSAATATMHRCYIQSVGQPAYYNYGKSYLYNCVVDSTGDDEFLNGGTLYEFGTKYATWGGNEPQHTNMWCAVPTDANHAVNKQYADALATSAHNAAELTNKQVVALSDWGPPTNTVNMGSSASTNNTDILFAARGRIMAQTGDGNDTGRVAITAGGDLSAARGSAVVMYGNENPAVPGYLIMYPGGVNDSKFQIANPFSATPFMEIPCISNFVTWYIHVQPGYSNALDLGSTNYPWRSLYLGTNSIYMNGVRVLGYDPAIGLRVGADLVPMSSNAYNIGSADFPIRDLYLDTNSVYMGGVKVLSYDPATTQLVVSVAMVQTTNTIVINPTNPADVITYGALTQYVVSVQSSDTGRWYTAYGWGNHATNGYATSNDIVVSTNSVLTKLASTNAGTEGIRSVGALGGYTLNSFFENTLLRGPTRDKPTFSYMVGWVPFPSLVVSWSVGDVYEPSFGYRHLTSGTNTLVNNAVNYAYWGTNAPNNVQWTTGTRPDAETTIFLGEFSTAFGAIMNVRTSFSAGDLPLQLSDGNAAVLPSIVVSGLIVFPTGTNLNQVSVTPGVEYQDMLGRNIHLPQDLSNTGVTYGLIYYYHTNSVATYGSTNILPIGYWDNGTNLTACNTSMWYRGVFVSMPNQPLLDWVMPSQEFTNYAAAVAGDDPTLPAGFEPYVPRSYAYVFSGEDTALRTDSSYWLDRRFMIRRGSIMTGGGGGSGTTPTLFQVLTAGNSTGGILPSGAGLPSAPDQLTSKQYVDSTINSINSYRAYVDSVSGNDGTAQLASSIKPFKTIQAAINAAAVVATDTNRYVVTLSPGSYTEDITMKNYIGLAASDIEATSIHGQITYPPAFTDYAGAELQQLTLMTVNRPALVFNAGDDEGYCGVRSCYIVADYDDNTTNKSAVVIKRGTVEIYATTYVEMNVVPTNGSESVCNIQMFEHVSDIANAGVVRFTSYSSSCVLYCDDENDVVSLAYNHDSDDMGVSAVQSGLFIYYLNTAGQSYSNSVYVVRSSNSTGRVVMDGTILRGYFSGTNQCSFFVGSAKNGKSGFSRNTVKGLSVLAIGTPNVLWLGESTTTNDTMNIDNCFFATSITNMQTRYTNNGTAGVLNYNTSFGSTYLFSGTPISYGGMPTATNHLVIKQYVDQMSAAGSNAYAWGNHATNGYATSNGAVAYAAVAGYATNAGYASVAGSATNAQNSGYATNAGYAAVAGSATNAQVAGYSTNAGFAVIAGFATNASVAATATNATFASTASFATNASRASYATNAGTASFATNASVAATATNAQYATVAGSSTNAQYALVAGSSTNAQYATVANTASNLYGLSATDTQNWNTVYTTVANSSNAWNTSGSASRFKAALATNVTYAIATQKSPMTNSIFAATGGGLFDSANARWYPKTTNRIVKLHGSFFVLNVPALASEEYMVYKNGTNYGTVSYDAVAGNGAPTRSMGKTWTFVDTVNASTNDFYEMYMTVVGTALTTGGGQTNNWWYGEAIP